MLPYTHITDHCFDAHSGVARPRVEELLTLLQPALRQQQARKHSGSAPLLAMPFNEAQLPELETLAAQLRARFQHIVVAGSGGSGLSGLALTQLRPLGAKPVFHYLDNVDPDSMEGLLVHIDVAETCFIIISKSGTTVETLSQMYVLLAQVEESLGSSAIAERFFLVTTAGDNPMRRAAAAHNFRVLDHAPDIGGRFAILSNVGLLPALIGGLDARALLSGAQTVVAQLDGAGRPAECEPALGAALQMAFMEQGCNISVMLPYVERLGGFSAWYRQCWAESLGKAGKGSTPVPAMGTTDQHSQLQLYLGGPRDKLFHLILLARAGTGLRIPVPESEQEALAYMRGKTMGDIMAAEQQATLETLVRNHCPLRLFKLGALGEAQVGALVMHFIIEIMFMSALLEIDPFDQPAVEEGKVLARDYLLSGEIG